MKKYASITIKAPTCNKNITIDITDCAGITEIFDKIDEVIRENKLLQKGDRLDFINFFETEEK